MYLQMHRIAPERYKKKMVISEVAEGWGKVEGDLFIYSVLWILYFVEVSSTYLKKSLKNFEWVNKYPCWGS